MKDAVPVPGVKVNIPVPESLFDALEYDGDARYIAAYWAPVGDEAEVTDGISTYTGDWQAYLTYMDHPVVRLGLVEAGVHPYAFGSSDSVATHWLVLDRKEHEAYAVLADAAAEFLRRQHGDAPEILELSPEAIMQAIAAAIEQVSVPTMEEIEETIREAQERVKRLRTDLDALAVRRSMEVANEIL